MTTTESPAESIENIVDDVIVDVKLEDELILAGKDVGALRRAIIKGANLDRDVLKSLVRLHNETIPNTKGLPQDQVDSELALNRDYLVTVATEFGYNK